MFELRRLLLAADLVVERSYLLVIVFEPLVLINVRLWIQYSRKGDATPPSVISNDLINVGRFALHSVLLRTLSSLAPVLIELSSSRSADLPKCNEVTHRQADQTYRTHSNV